MGSEQFLEKAKQLVKQYAIDHLDKSDSTDRETFEVYVVWSTKVLQHSKALLSTTLFDGMYYELTFNGDKDEIYLDAYKKFENKCIQV